MSRFCCFCVIPLLWPEGVSDNLSIFLGQRSQGTCRVTEMYSLMYISDVAPLFFTNASLTMEWSISAIMSMILSCTERCGVHIRGPWLLSTIVLANVPHYSSKGRDVSVSHCRRRRILWRQLDAPILVHTCVRRWRRCHILAVSVPTVNMKRLLWHWRNLWCSWPSVRRWWISSRHHFHTKVKFTNPLFTWYNVGSNKLDWFGRQLVLTLFLVLYNSKIRKPSKVTNNVDMIVDSM